MKKSRYKPCPKCGAERVHRSQRKSAWERCAGLIGVYYTRCHKCSSRFWNFLGKRRATGEMRGLMELLRLVAAVLVGVGLVVSAMVMLSRTMARY